jgi:hypothetical protein
VLNGKKKFSMNANQHFGCYHNPFPPSWMFSNLCKPLHVNHKTTKGKLTRQLCDRAWPCHKIKCKFFSLSLWEQLINPSTIVLLQLSWWEKNYHFLFHKVFCVRSQTIHFNASSFVNPHVFEATKFLINLRPRFLCIHGMLMLRDWEK